MVAHHPANVDSAGRCHATQTQPRLPKLLKQYTLHHIMTIMVAGLGVFLLSTLTFYHDHHGSAAHPSHANADFAGRCLKREALLPCVRWRSRQASNMIIGFKCLPFYQQLYFIVTIMAARPNPDNTSAHGLSETLGDVAWRMPENPIFLSFCDSQVLVLRSGVS